MESKKKPVETKTVADLGVEPSVTQQISSISPAPEREAGRKIEDDGEAHLAIIALLEQRKVI
jgi:electron transfer flavoprotein beta subunit